MQELFADVPEAIGTDGVIAEQCHVEIDFKTKHYPVYLPPNFNRQSYTKEEQNAAVEKFLGNFAKKGFPIATLLSDWLKSKRFIPISDPLQVVRERLEYEMSIIIPKGNERLSAHCLGFHQLGKE